MAYFDELLFPLPLLYLLFFYDVCVFVILASMHGSKQKHNFNQFVRESEKQAQRYGYAHSQQTTRRTIVINSNIFCC